MWERGACASVSLMSNFRIVEWVLRIGLGGFFIWSGGMKLLDLQSFTESVGNFQFPMEERMPGEMENWFEAPADAYIAYTLPWIEIFSGLAVLAGVGISGGLTILFGMLAAFNLGLWSAWNRGIKDLNCGCHGASDTPTNFPLKIASNFGLMILIGLIFWVIWEQRRIKERGMEIPEV